MFHQCYRLWAKWMRMVNYQTKSTDLFPKVDQARVPVKYLASLFSNGDTQMITDVYTKMLSVKYHRRNETVGDLTDEEVKELMANAKIDKDTANAIYQTDFFSNF